MFRCQASTHQVGYPYHRGLGIELTILLTTPPRCLAHIVNLATQAVISARTKSKYFNGDPTDDHIPEDNGDSERDEIGIVRAICIKVSSIVFDHIQC